MRAWRAHLYRRAGPLLWACHESTNPYDFFTSDPITEIPLRDFVSFVDETGKGYAMDIHSAVSLLQHAATTNEPPLNPFNRAPLPPQFLRRIARHSGATAQPVVVPISEEQRQSLAITDFFRAMEDLGYYTDPAWFHDLDRVGLQRVYLELADIWFHRASLTRADRDRIVPPPARPFPISTAAAIIMRRPALQRVLIQTCGALISSAATRGDKQTGTIYVLGALSVVSPPVGAAYPWLLEMFGPGRVTRVVNQELVVIHPSVLTY